MKQPISELTTEDFDYELPKELIALQPAPDRDASRLLVVSRSNDELLDRCFSDIGQYLQSGDLLILNDTKVFPARLYAHKPSGGKVEIMAERMLPDGLVKVKLKSNRTPKEGSVLCISEGLEVQICGRDEEFFILKFLSDLPVFEIFQRYGHIGSSSSSSQRQGLKGLQLPYNSSQTIPITEPARSLRSSATKNK